MSTSAIPCWMRGDKLVVYQLFSTVGSWKKCQLLWKSLQKISKPRVANLETPPQRGRNNLPWEPRLLHKLHDYQVFV